MSRADTKAAKAAAAAKKRPAVEQYNDGARAGARTQGDHFVYYRFVTSAPAMRDDLQAWIDAGWCIKRVIRHPEGWIVLYSAK